MKLLANKWFLLFVLALIWGSSFILIKKSLTVFSAIEVGALRVSIAGLIFLFWGIQSLKNIPRKLFVWVFLSGLLGNFIPMFLFPLAEEKVSSALAGILNSLVPIFVVILGFVYFGIRSRNRQIFGAILGFLGAFFLIYMNQSNDVENHYFHALYVVLATAMYATSGLILKQYLNEIPSFRLSSAIFSIWFLPSIMILFSLRFFHDFSSTQKEWEGLLYVAILGILGTAGAMILFYKLIQQTSAVFAASVTYLMPIVSVFWGAVFNEKLGVWHLIGTVLILIGVYLIREKSQTKIQSKI